MPANPVHHTATVDEPWDGGVEEARLATPVTKARGNGMYAWHDPSGGDADGDGYPDAKADSSFPHHHVDADGEPAAANMAGCRNSMSRMSQSNVPEADQADCEAHLQAHMDDGTPAGATILGPARPAFGGAFVRSAIAERPWAIDRRWLSMMLRAEGLPLAMPAGKPEPVAQSNFDRCGGMMIASSAVIPIHGVISQRADFWSWLFGGISLEEIRGALREVLGDPTVSSVIFDIDSPGGSVDGLTEFAAELRGLRGGAKPIASVIDPLCASAAYWIGSQVDEVIATPSGEAGSIGVYAAHEDDSAMLEMMGVKITLISAAPYKTEGNPYEPLSDDARAAIQNQIDTFYGMFLSDVAKGRGITPSQVASNYGEGRTMLAQKALAAGMVDRIDTLENTALRLGRSVRSVRKAATKSSTPTEQRLAASARPTLIAASGRTSLQPDRAWNKRMKGKIR